MRGEKNNEKNAKKYVKLLSESFLPPYTFFFFANFLWNKYEVVITRFW